MRGGVDTVFRLLRRYRLQSVSFITGFSLLTFELAASRVLAPSIGSSTYVWTGVIGVIIAALSFGFFTGGKLADARNRATDLIWLLMLASALATLTLISYEEVLGLIVTSFEDPRLQAVVAAFWLFAPTSFFIGITGPYLAKLNVQSLKSTGQAVAVLDMFNAIGGIAGTFVTGFILFGFIGAREAIGLVAVLLLISSWSFAPAWLMGRRVILSAIILLTVLTPAANLSGIVTIDTASAHYSVFNSSYNHEPVTGLLTGPGGTQSAVYQNGLSEPVFWYTQQMARLTIERKPNSILMLGGGAFTMPQYLSEQLPHAAIDVVEIDPQLESISKEYFNYKSPSNVRAIFTDGRTYINQTHRRYDIVLVDVYGDASIPFTFITKEYGQALKSILKPNGVVIANIIAGQKGECKTTFAAVDAGYRYSLPYGQYINQSGKRDKRANYIVAYSLKHQIFSGLKPLPTFDQQAYTDNYAPAERLYYACQQSVD